MCSDSSLKGPLPLLCWEETVVAQGRSIKTTLEPPDAILEVPSWSWIKKKFILLGGEKYPHYWEIPPQNWCLKTMIYHASVGWRLCSSDEFF